MIRSLPHGKHEVVEPREGSWRNNSKRAPTRTSIGIYLHCLNFGICKRVLVSAAKYHIYYNFISWHGGAYATFARLQIPTQKTPSTFSFIGGRFAQLLTCSYPARMGTPVWMNYVKVQAVSEKSGPPSIFTQSRSVPKFLSGTGIYPETN